MIRHPVLTMGLYIYVHTHTNKHNHKLYIIYRRQYLQSYAPQGLPQRLKDSMHNSLTPLPETSQYPWSKPSLSLKCASGDNGYSIWNLDFSQNTYNIWSPKLEMKHPISNMFLEKKKKSPLETGNWREVVLFCFFNTQVKFGPGSYPLKGSSEFL